MSLRITSLHALIALASCQCSEPLTSECTNGDVRACTCPDGAEGVQACAGGLFAACQCEIAPAPDAGNNEPDDDAGFPDDDDAGVRDAGISDPDAGTTNGGGSQIKIPSGSGTSSSSRFKARVRVGAPPGTPSPRSP